VILETRKKKHHLETNGDLIKRVEDIIGFDYVCVSPKNGRTIDRLKNLGLNVDFKLVTDCRNVNGKLLSKVNMLMPLTTSSPLKNKAIDKKVWTYCVNHNYRYSPRLQVDVWGTRRKGK
jgi:organic radical activating enzyme